MEFLKEAVQPGFLMTAPLRGFRLVIMLDVEYPSDKDVVQHQINT